MPINVTCPGCLSRFTVNEKFAGKKGPCPKCKNIIEIPKAEEQVVVHAPEHSELGARDAGGKLVLKPIERTESKIDPLLVAGFIAGSLLALVVALVLRNLEDKTVLLAMGAVVVAPPLCWGGYLMLRDDEELEPFRGAGLWIRVAVCSLLYAGLWGAFDYAWFYLFHDEPAEIWNVALLAPVFLALGGGAAMACFDFEFGNGFFHYSLYVLVTILLRLVMGLPPVGPEATISEGVALLGSCLPVHGLLP